MRPTNDRYYLAKRQPAPIQQAPGQHLSVRPVQGTIAHRQQQQPSTIHQHGIDTRPAQYQTMQSQGRGSQGMPEIRLPSLLQMTTAFAVAMLMLVSASMFSIGLTAYSNSVDRVDAQRQPNDFLHVR